jgi:hypothetical protein
MNTQLVDLGIATEITQANNHTTGADSMGGFRF